MSYPYEDGEPEGEDWYRQHDPEEQQEIKRFMNACPNCGEYVNKSNRDFSKENGPEMCRICEMKKEGYEVR
jgi:formylmethanofuran dehydrogenase subunit E